MELTTKDIKWLSGVVEVDDKVDHFFVTGVYGGYQSTEVISPEQYIESRWDEMESRKQEILEAFNEHLKGV